VDVALLEKAPAGSDTVQVQWKNTAGSLFTLEKLEPDRGATQM
jgi:hypothetical protein